jgi:hypothetical protein
MAKMFLKEVNENKIVLSKNVNLSEGGQEPSEGVKYLGSLKRDLKKK